MRLGPTLSFFSVGTVMAHDERYPRSSPSCALLDTDCSELGLPPQQIRIVELILRQLLRQTDRRGAGSESATGAYLSGSRFSEPIGGSATRF